MNMRNHGDSLGITTLYFIVFGESARIAKPRKCSFNNPTNWQNLKFWLDLFGNINANVVEFLKSVLESSAITFIAAPRNYGRITM